MTRRLFIAASVVAVAACGGGGGSGNENDNGSNGAPPNGSPQVFTTAAMVAGGDGFSLALRTDGTVFAWGDQELGSLGNDVVSQSSQRVPQQVIGLTRITQVAAGEYHAVALRDDGAVFTWGPNTDGMLGLGSAGGIFARAQQVPGISTAVAVAAGLQHSMVLLADGSVLTWGNNTLGQLGLGDLESRASPTPVADLTQVQKISAGGWHSAAILADGSVRMWGNNGNGQLGLGDTTRRTSPTVVSALANRGITQISAGSFHTLARDGESKAWAWGANTSGQAGGTFADRLLPDRMASLSPFAAVTTVSAGHSFSVALLSNRTALTWGNNGWGQLGNGQEGNSTSTNLPQLLEAQGIEAIAAGRNHTLVLLTDGRVGCTGSNFLGQCGRGDISDLTSVPVEVGPGFNAKP